MFLDHATCNNSILYDMGTEDSHYPDNYCSKLAQPMAHYSVITQTKIANWLANCTNDFLKCGIKLTTFIMSCTLDQSSVSNLLVCHLKLSNGLRCLPILVNKCPQTSLYVTKWNKSSWTAAASNQCSSNIPRLSLILKLSVWTSHSNIRSDLYFQFKGLQ